MKNKEQDAERQEIAERAEDIRENLRLVIVQMIELSNRLDGLIDD